MLDGLVLAQLLFLLRKKSMPPRWVSSKGELPRRSCCPVGPTLASSMRPEVPRAPFQAWSRVCA